MPFPLRCYGFMFILALGLVPYSQSFVVPLGIEQSIIQILSNRPFFILRAMLPGLDAATKLPNSSAMTSCIYLTFQDTDRPDLINLMPHAKEITGPYPSFAL